MTTSRALAPLGAASLGLLGAVAATLFLYRAAAGALDRVLEERLRGAGETGAELLARGEPAADVLRAVMEGNRLEGAYLLSPALGVIADATEPAPAQVNLLRVDPQRAAAAVAGRPSVEFAYAVGDLQVATGYFPVRGARGEVTAVLALEAGRAFAAARSGVRRGLWAALGLALVVAGSLAALARQWARREDERRAVAERAARGDALTRMAAMAAHEIRNPIGVIRGAVELVSQRAGEALGPDDREALADVLGEVDRLRRLTQDFLDFAREPALVPSEVDLARLAAEAAAGLGRSHPAVEVEIDLPPTVLRADGGRVQQVFANLYLNAAQAGARRIRVASRSAGASLVLTVSDDGPGISAAVASRLFEPFATGRAEGAGLGLALSRRIARRHGGDLRLAAPGPGAAFELELPMAGAAQDEE